MYCFLCFLSVEGWAIGKHKLGQCEAYRKSSSIRHNPQIRYVLAFRLGLRDTDHARILGPGLLAHPLLTSYKERPEASNASLLQRGGTSAVSWQAELLAECCGTLNFGGFQGPRGSFRQNCAFFEIRTSSSIVLRLRVDYQH